MRLINPLIILKILSTILLIETTAFLFCITVSLIYGESPGPFLWSALISGLLSISFYFISGKCDFSKITTREGYLSVTFSWLFMAVMGTLPYLFSNTIRGFINAFFESASGFTTTGSSIIPDVEIIPHSILFYRSLTHWLGGFGIILLVIIVLPSLRVSGYQLFSLESSLKEKIHPKTSAIGFRVLLIYLGLSAAEVILLSFGDMNLFDSICHTFGTVATGGFSTKNLGLAAYGSYSQYIVMIFMFLAGTSFLLYYYFFKFNFRKIKQNDEYWFYIGVVLCAGFLATFILMAKTDRVFEVAFREGFFQVISIVSCTGFTSSDYMLWPVSGLLLIFILMFSGGSTGSTSGGIKMARHLIVIKNIKNVFVKLTHPNAVSMVKLNGKTVSENTNISIISFVVLYLFVFIIGTLILTANGSDPLTSASATATCMAGIGPGLGTVGPMSNFAHLPDLSKIVLSLLMILGRLELITIFSLFTKTFWRL